MRCTWKESGENGQTDRNRARNRDRWRRTGMETLERETETDRQRLTDEETDTERERDKERDIHTNRQKHDRQTYGPQTRQMVTEAADRKTDCKS